MIGRLGSRKIRWYRRLLFPLGYASRMKIDSKLFLAVGNLLNFRPDILVANRAFVSELLSVGLKYLAEVR